VQLSIAVFWRNAVRFFFSLFKIIFVPNAFISYLNTQTTHITSWIHNSTYCYAFPKNLYPGGIRTRVICFWDGCDVHCATPPGPKVMFVLCQLALSDGHVCKSNRELFRESRHVKNICNCHPSVNQTWIFSRLIRKKIVAITKPLLITK
jgi:hypothetical protein